MSDTTPSKESIEEANRFYVEHFDSHSGKKTVAALAHALDKARLKGREEAAKVCGEYAEAFCSKEQREAAAIAEKAIRSLHLQTPIAKDEANPPKSSG